MKSETITIRTTQEEKEQLQQIADKKRRTLGGLLYLWIIERMEEEPSRSAWEVDN